MKLQKYNSTTGLLLFSLVANQTLASEDALEISELCRSSKDWGIKRVVTYILEDEGASATEILCQQRLNKKSNEAVLEATYSTNQMNDSSFRQAQSTIENPAQARFKSDSSQSAQTYSDIAEPIENSPLPTLKGFQTVPQ